MTIALPVAIASRTFIRMPPPLRTGARTTAARSRWGRTLATSAMQLDARAGQLPHLVRGGAADQLQARLGHPGADRRHDLPRQPERRIAVG